MKSSTRNSRRVSVMLALAMLLSYIPTPGALLTRSTIVRTTAPSRSGVTAQPSSKTSASADKSTRSQVVQAFGKLPVSFEPNRGQFDPQVKFMTRGGGYTMFLTATETVFVMRSVNQSSTRQTATQARPKSIAELQKQVLDLQKEKAAQRNQALTARSVVRMKLSGANEGHAVSGMDELPGKVNHFWSNNPRKWATDIPLYAKVQYAGVYPGIDMVYYGGQSQLEYDFVVSPGADPNVIAINFEGADRVEVDAEGNLSISAKGNVLRQQKPHVYQDLNGKRQEIQSRFVRKNAGVGFSLGNYDTAHPLIIDPVLSYSTFLGDENNDDNAFDIAVDAEGNAYVAGQTFGDVFPTEDPFQSVNPNGNADAFITKFNPAGSALIYSSYLGGTFDEAAYGLALDSDRNVYLTGYTDSADFPRQNAMQQTCGATVSGPGGTACAEDEAFVTKIAAAGNHLIFSTYLGGSATDRGRGIAVDSNNNVYVTGFTGSYNFPTTHPIQPFANGLGSLQESADYCCFTDAFLTKIEPGGQFRVYSTFIGGAQDDVAMGIAVDSSGNAYITGFTDSTHFDPTPAASSKPKSPGPTVGASPTPTPLFPTTEGAFQPQPSATGFTREAFVTKVNAAGSAYTYSTFLGGSQEDEAYGIALGADGSAYVTGYTDSPGTPPQAVPNRSLAIAGPGGSPDFPTTPNAYQAENKGGYDAFITRFTPDGSNLIYSSLIGGEHDEGSGNANFRLDEFDGAAIAVDFAGNAFITGWTESTAAPSPTPTCVSSFDYTSFGETPGLTLNGSAASSGIALRLTPDAINQDGSAFNTEPVNGSSDFTTTFGFQINVTDSTGAEGFAFNLTNDGVNTLPTEGEKGTTSDLSVSFDTHNNGTEPSENFVRVFFLGNQIAEQDLDTLDTPINLSDGNAHTATVTFSSDSQSVNLLIDGQGVVVATADLSLISPSTFIGFSARTTNFSETHDILNWSFSGAASCANPGILPVNFPTKNAVQPLPGSNPGDFSPDAFVAKFNTNSDGPASLIYSTFLGGYQNDEGQGIAVDLAGNAYVTGKTGNPFQCVGTSTHPKAGPTPVQLADACTEDNNFPTTPGSFNPTKCDEVNSNLDQDAFVTKIGGGGFIGSGDNNATNDQTFSIAGKVTKGDGTAVEGVTIAITRTGNATAGTPITDSNGIYSLDGLAADTYTLTPDRTGFSFNPPNQTVTITNANVRADFTATALFSISGMVSDGNSNPVPGVTITITNTGNATVGTATTINDGTYTVSGIPEGGPYTVTPSKQFYTFAPPSSTIANLNSDQTGVNFVATQQSFSISGHIATASGSPVSGVTVALAGTATSSTTTNASGDYAFANLNSGGNYTVTPTKPNFSFAPPFRTINGLSGNATADFVATAGTVGFTAAASPNGSESSRNEGAGSFQVTVTRTGDTSGATDVEYATFDGPSPGPVPLPSPGPPPASERSDYITSLGHLHFAAGETTKIITIFIVDDAFVEGNEVLTLALSNPTNGEDLGSPSAITLTIVDNDFSPTNVNPIDNTAFFVHQHYLDFLNREPDAAGLAFWSNQIDQCSNAANRGPSETEAQCVARKRVQVSKAFFLSIEFQETGFLVIRAYRAALDRYPEFREFLLDTQELQRGVVVGQGNWQLQLENNKQAFMRASVGRPEFLTRYPEAQTRDQYIDGLFAAAHFTPTTAERQQVSDAYDSGAPDQTESRARALRTLAEHDRFRTREFNGAFVTMQYIGYLRRNPDDPGFNFWLGVLNANNDQNQMVNAFITSGEYRQRFGQ